MKGESMKQKNSLCEALNHLKSIIMIVTFISYFLCLADISLASGWDNMIDRDSHSTAESGESSTIFLGENVLELDLQQSIKIILPNREGIEINLIPFYLTKLDSSSVEIFLQDNDTSGNTIVVSDTCEVIGIIAILLAAACLIYPDPILCTISTVMQGIFRLLCQ